MVSIALLSNTPIIWNPARISSEASVCHFFPSSSSSSTLSSSRHETPIPRGEKRRRRGEKRKGGDNGFLPPVHPPFPERARTHLFAFPSNLFFSPRRPSLFEQREQVIRSAQLNLYISTKGEEIGEIVVSPEEEEEDAAADDWCQRFLPVPTSEVVSVCASSQWLLHQRLRSTTTHRPAEEWREQEFTNVDAVSPRNALFRTGRPNFTTFLIFGESLPARLYRWLIPYPGV